MESQQPSPFDKLNEKQRLFVELFCQYRNGARAAREAGYAESGCRQEAYRLLTNADILAAISQLMEQTAMSKGEALGRMTAYGRGTMEYFLTEEGELTLTSDEAKANRDLLKKIRQRKIVRTTPTGDKIEETHTEIELHDAKDAVDKLLQVYVRANTKIDLSNLTEDQIDEILTRAMNKLD
ncbi:terminase small subunit [Spirosoma gilvum]